MYKLIVICPERIAKGFTLTGIEVLVSDAGSRTQELLTRLMTQREMGVVLLPQEHLADFDPRMLKKLDALQLPLVVPIPMGSEATLSPEEYVKQTVRRALGYEIKI
ncbi:MAG: hypothetical protein HY590_06480 [Candidatus Omnitrophica bacterium]|nr:hypothetical protein [Candidatus Omnitrophota bacterium]